MKKILFLIVGVLLFVGCNNMMNTPTKQVEKFLNKYQTLDKEVLNQLDTLVDNDNTYVDTQKDRYKDILKRQYKNLTYTIKDETVDGNTATVEVEIEVYDYNRVLNEADNYISNNNNQFFDENNALNQNNVLEYKLTQLTNASEKIKYTLSFVLNKVDDIWTLQELSEDDLNKIHGIYR